MTSPDEDVALLADRFYDAVLDLRYHLDPPERAELAGLLRHLAACVESPRPDGDE